MVARTYDGPHGLKPGNYLYAGGQIKALDAYTALFESGNDGKTPTPEVITATVSWAWAALQERRDTLREIQTVWTKNGEPLEDDEIVLMFDPLTELPRLDAAITLHGAAYLYKVRNRASKLIGLRFLDPDTMTPDDDSRDEVTGELTRYWRQLARRRISVPADDVIRVFDPGLREDAPWSWAGRAAGLSGQIAKSILETLDWFFETNGLPVQLISVPAGTTEETRERIEGRLRRMFNRRAKETNKSIGVSGEVTITPLSLAPTDLDTLAITDQQREAIFAAFGVPAALVFKDVNMAEAREKRAMFVGRMGGIANLYGRLISRDIEVQQTGFAIRAYAERHEAIQRQELEKAEAIQRLAGAPVISINEARERLELEPLAGEEYNAPVVQFGQRVEEGEAQPANADSANDAKAAEVAKLRQFVAAGKYRRRAFESDLLTASEVATEIKRYEMQTEYIEAVKQFAEAMRADV